MKIRSLLLLAGLMAAVGSAAAALPSLHYASAKAAITFQTARFRDIKDSDLPTDRGEKGLLDLFGKYILATADGIVPAGYRLVMVFTDIDYAGDFEPWHGPQADDIRVIKAIYPPRYKFTWKVTDPSGKVVRGGDENLVDLDYQMKDTLADDLGPLREDKNEIHEWMRAHLGRLK